jgi:hypothetical protein
VRRGLSLTEMVLSIALMLLVILFVFELYPMAMSSVRASGQRLQANELADTVLADWMQRDFDLLVVGPAPAMAPVNGKGTVFQPAVEILPVSEPGVDPTMMRAIRVRVTWRDRVQREIVRTQWRTRVKR